MFVRVLNGQLKKVCDFNQLNNSLFAVAWLWHAIYFSMLQDLNKKAGWVTNDPSGSLNPGGNNDDYVWMDQYGTTNE